MSEATLHEDPLTGRKVWECTSVGDFNRAFYFHDRTWSHDGQWLYLLSKRPTGDDPDGEHLKLYRMTPPDGEPQRLPGTRWGHFIVYPDDRYVMEQGEDSVFRVNTETGARKKLLELDPEYDWTKFHVSCDGRQLVGARSTRPEFEKTVEDFPDRETYNVNTWLRPDVRVSWLVVADAATGESEEVTHSRDWYTHTQWSPTDPELISFAHEGNWLQVRRMWLIRANGHGLRQGVQTRKGLEGLGHEFFTPDGSAMWGHGYRPPEPYTGGPREFNRYSRFIFRQSLGDPDDYREWPEEKVSRHWNVGENEDWILGDGTHEPEYDSAAIWRAWVDLDSDALEFEPIASTEGHDDVPESSAQISPDWRWVVWTSRQFSETPQVCLTEL
jgi:oligogalacturonide lyase